MSQVITGIRVETTGPVSHGAIFVQAPKGLGTGVFDERYQINDYSTALPLISTANASYSGRFDDVGYYV